MLRYRGAKATNCFATNPGVENHVDDRTLRTGEIKKFPLLFEHTESPSSIATQNKSFPIIIVRSERYAHVARHIYHVRSTNDERI